MEAAHQTPSPSLTNSPSGPFRPILSDAIHFWEIRRIFYNLALVAASLVWLIATWPHFRPAFNLIYLPPIAVLALLANVCYCAAYMVDIPMQHSTLSTAWKRYRWVLWLAGTLFALLLANYWIADEIYPDFH
jgi:hypothetical protein